MICTTFVPYLRGALEGPTLKYFYIIHKVLLRSGRSTKSCSGDVYGMASLAIQTLERKLLVYSSEREGGFKGVLQSAQDAEFAQVSWHLGHESRR